MTTTTINETVSRAFRDAFESHPARQSDPALALESARETASATVPTGVTGTFDDSDLTFVADDVHCACGDWSGEQCAWTGPASEMVTVEYMPEHLRASHTAAGNRGSYPANGAQRVRAEKSCAERMLSNDGDWVRILG